MFDDAVTFPRASITLTTGAICWRRRELQRENTSRLTLETNTSKTMREVGLAIWVWQEWKQRSSIPGIKNAALWMSLLFPLWQDGEEGRQKKKKLCDLFVFSSSVSTQVLLQASDGSCLTLNSGSPFSATPPTPTPRNQITAATKKQKKTKNQTKRYRSRQAATQRPSRSSRRLIHYVISCLFSTWLPACCIFQSCSCFFFLSLLSSHLSPFRLPSSF